MSDTLTARDKYHLKKYGSVDSPVRLAMKNGGSVVEHRDTLLRKFDNGGNIEKYPWEENPNSPENREETQQYLSRQQERINAKENEINNPSVGRLAGEALGMPYRWMANPQNIVGDITGYNIGPNSQQDILSARRNNVYGRNNLQEAATMLPSALYNVGSVVSGDPRQIGSMLSSNYMADSNTLEAIGTGIGNASGWPRSQSMSNLSEEGKRAGGVTDFKQAISDYEKGNIGIGLFNTASGIGGVFNIADFPGINPNSNVGKAARAVDWTLEQANRIGDYRDVGLGLPDKYKYDILDVPKDIKAKSKEAVDKSKKLYLEYKRKQELNRQRTESARKNKEATDRRDALERIKNNNIIVPSKENDYRMYKPKNELPEIVVTGRKKIK